MLDVLAGTPIEGLADTLRRQLESKRDLIAPTPRMSFAPVDVDGKLMLDVDLPDGAESFDVLPHAHGQISTHLEVPRKLYDRLQTKHPGLFTHLVNGLFAQAPADRLVRTMDGDVRAFLSNRYRMRDNWDLLNEAVLPVLAQHPGKVRFSRCDLTDTHMFVKIVLPDFERQITPKVGDVVHGGLLVKNSEVGASSLVIAPYTEVLWCTNGSTYTDLGQSQRHVGKRIDVADGEASEFFSDATLRLDDEAFFAKCRDVVTATLNEQIFETIVSQMRDLAGIKVEGSPVAAVKVLADRHRLTDAEGDSMLEIIAKGGDLSAWGYVNGLTQTARDLDDPDRQTELEVLAGKLTADPAWARSMAAA